MDYRSLGQTGIKVSPLCLGAMMFGSRGNPDHDDCIKIIHRALDAGINFIDTADVYSQGESETIVGKALKSVNRDEVVVATKVHGTMGSDPNQAGNSRRWILTEVENSLRRLGVDHIDLYQIHRPDPDVAIEETLGALTELQRAGKIRAFGCSTFPASQIVESHWTAERRALGRFMTEQPPYSILVRGIESEVLPVCQSYGMGVLVWSPLAGGWLSGRYGIGKENTSNRAQAGQFAFRYDVTRAANQRKLEIVTELAKLADKAGITLVELAVAFTINHPGVTSAIIGPRTMEQLETQLGVPDITLSAEILDAIDALAPPGTDVAPGEMGYTTPAVADPRLRRR